jgi:hypothetical protein
MQITQFRRLSVPLIVVFKCTDRGPAHNTGCGPWSEKLGAPVLCSTLAMSPTLPSKSFTYYPRIDVALSEMLTAQ